MKSLAPAKSTAANRTKKPARLPPEKGAELVGLVLLVGGVLLGLALVTYHPADPSLLHRSSGERDVRNLIGPLGAETAAGAFQLVGLAAFALPLMILVAAWRRLLPRPKARVVGRGVGAVIVLVSLPPLLQLTLGDVTWQGFVIHSGGAFGDLLTRQLRLSLSFTGTLFVLLGGLAIGLTLLIQSTLGELLVAWQRRAQALYQRLTLSWARRRERKAKERSRRRVVTKHLERAAEKKAAQAQAARGEDPSLANLPLRVTEKSGERSFSVRRVRPGEQEAEGQQLESPRPQRRLAFPGPPAARGPLPPLNLLQLDPIESSVEEDDLVQLGELIRKRCGEFGVEGTVEGISPGPVITVFEFQPAPGVKVSQIVNLQDDLALALKAEAVRIERLPGRSTLGIEVPNKTQALIHLGHLLARDEFQKSPSPLTMALGTTIHGEPYYADLTTMPHLLVAGATGSGKSVGLQSMITSIVYKASREEVQFIFIDPKRIELGVYAKIPHLKAEVVVEPKKAANALRWAVVEMERRYRLLAEAHVRSIGYYNRAIRDPQVQERLALADSGSEIRSDDLKPLPYYVVVIDELADLILMAAAEVESAVARLAQMARAVGIHLIVATQRPSVDVLTGTIKANFPCRLSYATATRHDSRTILDQIGAEKLLGRGDMLFMPPGTSRIIRLHGAYVSEQETAALVRWLKKQGQPELDPAVLAPPEQERSGMVDGSDDELFDEAARLVVEQQQASASFLQRRLRIGFSRAARLIDIMEQEGILGPPQGSKPRKVLVKRDYFSEVDQMREEV